MPSHPTMNVNLSRRDEENVYGISWSGAGSAIFCR
jgi:hypothetical protein